jgi:hypothetical protein
MQEEICLGHKGNFIDITNKRLTQSEPFIVLFIFTYQFPLLDYNSRNYEPHHDLAT